jgi:hypothetical protein
MNLARNGCKWGANRKNGVRVQKLTKIPLPYAPFMPRSLRIEFPGAYYHPPSRKASDGHA